MGVAVYSFKSIFLSDSESLCSQIHTLLRYNKAQKFSYTAILYKYMLRTSHMVNCLNRMEKRHIWGEIRSCGFHWWRSELTHQTHTRIRRKAQTHLNGVIPQAADDLLVVVLQTVNTLTVLRPALDPLQVVSAAPPVRFDGLKTAMKRIKTKLDSLYMSHLMTGNCWGVTNSL